MNSTIAFKRCLVKARRRKNVASVRGNGCALQPVRLNERRRRILRRSSTRTRAFSTALDVKNVVKAAQAKSKPEVGGQEIVDLVVEVVRAADGVFFGREFRIGVGETWEWD
jgi:hypothetical protein